MELPQTSPDLEGPQELQNLKQVAQAANAEAPNHSSSGRSTRLPQKATASTVPTAVSRAGATNAGKHPLDDELLRLEPADSASSLQQVSTSNAKGGADFQSFNDTRNVVATANAQQLLSNTTVARELSPSRSHTASNRPRARVERKPEKERKAADQKSGKKGGYNKRKDDLRLEPVVRHAPSQHAISQEASTNDIQNGSLGTRLPKTVNIELPQEMALKVAPVGSLKTVNNASRRPSPGQTKIKEGGFKMPSRQHEPAQVQKVPTEAEIKQLNRELMDLQGQMLGKGPTRQEKRELRIKADAKEKEVVEKTAIFKQAREEAESQRLREEKQELLELGTIGQKLVKLYQFPKDLVREVKTSMAADASEQDWLQAVIALTPGDGQDDVQPGEVDLSIKGEKDEEDMKKFLREAREQFAKAEGPQSLDSPDKRPIFGWMPLGSEHMIWGYNYAHYNNPEFGLTPPLDDGEDDRASDAVNPLLKEYRRAAQMIEIQLLKGLNEVNGKGQVNGLIQELRKLRSDAGDFVEDIVEFPKWLESNYKEARKLLQVFESLQKKRVPVATMQSTAERIFFLCQEKLDHSGSLVKLARNMFLSAWKQMHKDAWGEERNRTLISDAPDSDAWRPLYVLTGIEDVSQEIEKAINIIVRADEVVNTCMGRLIPGHHKSERVITAIGSTFQDIARENTFADAGPAESGSARERFMTLSGNAQRDFYQERAKKFLATKVIQKFEDYLKPLFQQRIRKRIISIFLKRQDGECCCDLSTMERCTTWEKACYPGMSKVRCELKTVPEILNEEVGFYKKSVFFGSNSSQRLRMFELLQQYTDDVMNEIDTDTDPQVLKTWVQGHKHVEGEVDAFDCLSGMNAFTEIIDKIIPKPGDVVKFSIKLRIPPAPPFPAYITIGLVGEAARGIQGHIVGLPQYGSPEWTELKLTLSIGGDINLGFARWSHDFALIIRAAATGANRAMKGLWYVVYQVFLERDWGTMATFWSGQNSPEDADIMAAAYEEYIFDPRARGNVAFGDLMLYTKSSFTVGLPGVMSFKLEGGVGAFQRFNAKTIQGVYGEGFKRAVASGVRPRVRDKENSGLVATFGWTPRFHFLFEGKFLSAFKVQGMYAQAGAAAWGVWLKTSFPIFPAGLGVALSMIRGINAMRDIYNDIATWMSQEKEKSRLRDGAGPSAVVANIDQVQVWQTGVDGCAQALKTSLNNVTLSAALGDMELAFYMGGKVLPENPDHQITYARLELNLDTSISLDAEFVAVKMSLKRRLMSFGVQKLLPNTEWKLFTDYNGEGRLPYDDNIPEM